MFSTRMNSIVSSAFTYFCIYNVIDIALRTLLERGCTLNQNYDFLFAFLKSDLAIVQSFCTERLEVFRTLTKVDFLSLILRSNQEFDEFIIGFMKTMNLKKSTSVLFRTAAIHGRSDLIQSILASFPKQTFLNEINDDLIAEMFTASTKYRKKHGMCSIFVKYPGSVDNRHRMAMNLMGLRSEREQWKHASFSGYVDTLNSIIKSATENDNTLQIDHVFEKNETRVLARLVVQNRLDVVEKLFRYHYVAFKYTVDLHQPIECADCAPRTSDIDLMCCAVSSWDHKMVRSLTEQGENVNRLHIHVFRRFDLSDSYRLSASVYTVHWESGSFPTLFCALVRLSATPVYNYLEEYFEENQTLENLNKIISDFANATLFSRVYEKSISAMSIIFARYFGNICQPNSQVYNETRRDEFNAKIRDYFGDFLCARKFLLGRIGEPDYMRAENRSRGMDRWVNCRALRFTVTLRYICW